MIGEAMEWDYEAIRLRMLEIKLEARCGVLLTNMYMARRKEILSLVKEANQTIMENNWQHEFDLVVRDS